MLLPLYLYLCWESLMCWIHNVVASVSLFGQNEYIKVLCSINAFLYLCRVLCSIQAPLYLCWESGSVSLFGERETASDRIYEDRVFDPRSPQLALHNSTSNHIGAKVRRPFLSIQFILIFLTHASSSAIFVLIHLRSLLFLF